MEDIKKKVSLSNDGLSAYVEEFKTYTFKAVIKPVVLPTGVTVDKFVCEPLELQGSEYVLKDGIEMTDVTDYLNTFYKVINRKRIVDSDKFLFLRSSVFPRTSFNRYSQKAKRVQIHKTATKYVIGSNKPNLIHMHHHWNTRFYAEMAVTADYNYGEVKNSSYGHDIKTIHQLESIEGQPFYNVALAKLKKAVDKYNSNTNECVLDFYEGVNQVKSLTNKKHGYTTCNEKEREVLEMMLKGTYPISKIVTDTGVNEYIDGFKTVLDKGTYEMLLTALGNGDSNLVMGLKLLENMSLRNSKPYLHALMLESFNANGGTISYNSVYKGIGMQNLRDNFKIDSHSAPSQRGHMLRAETGIRKIQRVHDDLLETEEDRAIFRDLMSERVKECFSHILDQNGIKFLDIMRKVKPV